MTLHSQELAQIERREAAEDTKKYEICSLAFDGCRDAKNPEIFYGICDKNGKGCGLVDKNIMEAFV